MHTQTYPICTECAPFSMYQMPKMHTYETMCPPHPLIMQMRPLVDYALKEAEQTNVKHAMTEAVLIAYLMGTGCSIHKAHQLVESWEVNESFKYPQI